jgi:drug/metabolite transporter (DMT)-like permease
MKLDTLLRGAGLLLVAAVAWGGMFPVALITLARLDPFYLTTVRYAIAALLLLGLLAVAEGRGALALEGKGIRLAVLGSLGFAGLGLLVSVGLLHSRPEHGGIIMGTQPLIAAVVAWALKGTRPAKSTWVFLGIAFAGAVLVITKGHFTGLFDEGTGWGDLMMFVGAVAWVIYTLGATEFPSWSPLRYTALTCVLALPAIFGITLAATATGHVAVPSAAAIESVGWQLVYIIGIASVLGVVAWNAGNKLIGAQNGVLFINFVPITVFAIRMAQGHRFAAIEFVGAALVIAALIGNNIVTKRSGPRMSTTPRSPAHQASHRVTGLRDRGVHRGRSTQPQGCG